jgi:hypothetical protein
MCTGHPWDSKKWLLFKIGRYSEVGPVKLLSLSLGIMLAIVDKWVLFRGVHYHKVNCIEQLMTNYLTRSKSWMNVKNSNFSELIVPDHFFVHATLHLHKYKTGLRFHYLNSGFKLKQNLA